MAVRRMVRIAFLSAVLTVTKLAIFFIPQVELISLLVVVYALLLGKDAFIIVTIFSLTEGLIWPFGLWWVSYLYVWPLLCLIVILLKRFIKEEFFIWAVVSGMFGLVFGSLFAIAYLPTAGFAYALAYWVSGLPMDVWHGGWNFVLMALAGRPIYKVIRRFVV